MYNSNYHTTKDLIRVKRDRITYNTYMDPIELRGYGRNIQNMVEHCLTIEDRAERTKAALSTLVSMHKIRPDIDKLTTLCDHLYFISGYELDIDYPNGYKPVKLEKLTSGPSRIIYPGKQFAFRHYGFNLETLIQKALATENEETRKSLIRKIAFQMKRNYVLFNKDTVTDNRIFNDLRDYSEGRIDIHEGEMKLPDAKHIMDSYKNTHKAETKKKKKKK
ncbi:MAG: DUF4290 domain-containing protein [Paludibacteraceae bacterium]|nr:DUF4290 domain-containing protein [Paludibacteraceae bacterium]